MKTRFAPSPTGYIHIGNVRSAIYPYLLARQNDGKFILRIEDTDQARYVKGATDLIEDTLRWLGLEWDEGPVVGGPNGPYFQTERRNLYLEWAEKLIKSGRAYYDSTPSSKIQEYRDECTRTKKPFLYRNYRPAERSGMHDFSEGHKNPAEDAGGISVSNCAEERKDLARAARSVSEGHANSTVAPMPVIRFKSDPKPRTWHDEVMGDMHAGPEVQDDIVLIKADGLPTYNFAHIVDDALMGVTHVIRGVEYLPSTPNYLALYEAFGLEVPKLVSLPHILAPTGNKKLGKRDGAKSVTEYREDGVLPEAMLNYLANLGWNDGTEQEIYTKSDLIKKFSLDKVQTSGARYDETKLYWLNGQWIRKIATGQKDAADTNVDIAATKEGIDELYSRTSGFWPESAANYDDDYKKRVLSIIYDRLKTLADLKTMSIYFFEDPRISLDMITENKFLKKLSEEELSALLQTSTEKLQNTNWTADDLQNTLNDLLAETGKKPAELFSIIRIALSYAPFSPALPLTMEVLGKDLTLARIQKTITALEND